MKYRPVICNKIILCALEFINKRKTSGKKWGKSPNFTHY